MASESFDAERRTGIGATDSPKILGLSRYGSALTVYEDKVGEPPQSEDNLPSWLGLRLQQTVGELYTTATGIQIRAANTLFRHHLYPWLICHLDFRGLGDTSLLVEAKTRSHTKGWGADGSQHIPEDVWVQVQHEMLVARGSQCHVAVLFSNRDFRVYPIQRDDTFLAALVPKLEAFWNSHVIARVPPPASSYSSDGAALTRLYPSREGIRSATPEQSDLVRRYREAEAAAVEAGAAMIGLKNRIIQLMEGHEGLEGPFGVITNKITKDSQRTDWKAVADACRFYVDEEEFDKIVEQRTKTLPGYPQFRPSWSDEE